MTMKPKYFYLLVCFLFIFRIGYGLCSEFWFADELQIYLIGLKSYTTQSWPFYGPDIVYTNTQIPGALQGLLISLPLNLFRIPESPGIFLNILSFFSLSFLAYFISYTYYSLDFVLQHKSSESFLCFGIFNSLFHRCHRTTSHL